MCEFFVNADPILYESRTRSIRIHGVQSSIRLENFVWDTLSILAAEEGMTTNALIVQFHDEILRHRGDVLNFTSFLRVTCLRYLRRKCDQLGGAKATENPLELPLLPQPETAHTTH
ncbi:ribbon-helix-helix domain-containing protein [Cupriavidus sp. 2SB]|uniref:ribbon-helix-helix domain-containing protein n=1 Tax=Cupriavidus sp. 2SB TaxID=2502199 RepID=UPI0010F682FB|nr:ribbon-helix-helix domain-containing protein [Cupriavidus sp. 2SB]